MQRAYFTTILLAFLFLFSTNTKADNADCCIRYTVEVTLQNGNTIKGYYIYEYNYVLQGKPLLRMMQLQKLDTLLNDKGYMHNNSSFVVYSTIVPITAKCNIDNGNPINGTTEKIGHFVPNDMVVKIPPEDIKTVKVLAAKCLCCRDDIPLTHPDMYCGCIPTAQVITELSRPQIDSVKNLQPEYCGFFINEYFGGFVYYNYNTDFTGQEVEEMVTREIDLSQFAKDEKYKEGKTHYEQKQKALAKKGIIVFMIAIQI